MMTVISPSDEIRSRLTMDEVARYYGFHPNRTGYICCPFHHEKTASLKIYPGTGGWHCFGCGAGGSVIDFVMQLFSISFSQAIIRISADFCLGLTAQRPTKAEASRILEERREKEREKEEAGREYLRMAKEHCRLWQIAKTAEPMSDEWVESVKKLPYLEWWLDENIST